MDSSTGIASVKCLYVDRDNRLWIGTNESGVFLMERGEFRCWDEKAGLKSTSIRSILQRGDGLIYIATTDGIASVDQEMNFRVLDDLELRIPLYTNSEKERTALSTVWITAEISLFWRMKKQSVICNLKTRRPGGSTVYFRIPLIPEIFIWQRGILVSTPAVSEIL
jgi:ligand-binding sensor domain-containing protein